MNADRISFRQAETSDTDFLLSLRLATMSDYIERSGTSLSRDEQLQRVLSHFESIGIVVLDRARDIGMVKLAKSPNVWHLVQIQIVPELQRSGIGTGIVNDLVIEANQRGVSLRLSVLKVNPAKALYDRLGFVVVEEKETSFEMEWRR